MANLSRKVLIVIISGYRRFLSPLLPPSCRFFPSCSAYTIEAVRRHGCVKGAWLGLVRLLRCHPLHQGGVDPVP